MSANSKGEEEFYDIEKMFGLPEGYIEDLI